MAYFMLAMLRMGGVLASRTELQDKGASTCSSAGTCVNEG